MASIQEVNLSYFKHSGVTMPFNRNYGINLALGFILISFADCTIETALPVEALFDTICVTLTDSYSSEIKISCPDSTIIGLTDVIIGIREGCAGNNKDISCCRYEVTDTLIGGQCLRQNLVEHAGLYDKVVNDYLQTFSGKTGGIFRYSANVPIPTSLGYNASLSSYIMFKYQCKPAKYFITLNHTTGNGTQAIDMTSSGMLKIEDSVYLGTKSPMPTEDHNSSIMMDEYMCLIHTEGGTVDIKINVLDIRFEVSDSSECNDSSLKFVDIKNDVNIFQQECNSWFSPFNIKITDTLGVLVILTVPRQFLTAGTSIWLEINSNTEKNVEVRCGNIEDKLKELLRKPGFRSMTTSEIALIAIGAIAFIILVIFLIWGVLICYRKKRRATDRTTEDQRLRCSNEYDYSTVPQSMPKNTQGATNEGERVVYDKTKVEIHAISNDNYDILQDKKWISDIDNSEVDDNYDHFTSVTSVKIATESNDYDHV